MATTIQTIEVPKKARALDTSGNNNHGQIYSGRGLEFDGVSDYLDAGDVVDMGTDSLTLAVWAKGNTSSVHGSHLLTKQANYNANALGYGLYWRHSEDRIVFNVGDGTDGNRIEYDLEANTWYRFVGTYNSSTGVGVLYANGVQVATATDTDIGNLDNSENLKLGGNAIYFDGMMSDGQVWNTAWSAADVTYDYLNPESLALNRGGTSLTESNLKLWYPMQDGHRGQQSYILDGANTGLNDNIVTGDNSTFATGIGDWGQFRGVAAHDSSLQAGKWTDNNTGGGSTGFTMTGGNIPTIAATTYTIEFSAKTDSAASFNFTYIGEGTTFTTINNPNLTSSFQDYKFRFTTSTANQRLYIGFGVSPLADTESYWIDNVSIKTINAKNHATTVFYGDELVENGDFAINEAETQTRLDGGVQFDNWTEAPSTGTRTCTAITNGVRSTTGDVQTNSWDQRIYQDVASDLVIGRTYSFSCSFLTSDGSDMRVAIQTKGSADVQIGSTYATVADEEQTLSGTFVCSSTTDQVIDVWPTTPQAGGEYFDLKSVTLKEVGLASGWTDADQQLHIPQTALQSYNELAWFQDNLGTNNPQVTASHHNDFNPEDGDFTISAWVYQADLHDDNYFFSQGGGGTSGWNTQIDSSGNPRFVIEDDDGSNNGTMIAAIGSTAIPTGEFFHFVGVINRTTDYIHVYINGVEQDSTDISAINNPIEHSAGVLKFGSWDPGYSGGVMNGTATEFSIFKGVAFSQAEIIELYNDGKALDATTHSQVANLKGYWRNNGLATWTNINNPGTHDGTLVNATETILIPAGVDATRDNQGFIMNKQKDTSSLNLTGSETDYVTVGDYSILDIAGTTITLSAWVYFDDSDAKGIVGKWGDSTATNRSYLMRKTTSEIEFYTGNGSAIHASTSASISDGWRHIVCVYDGSNKKIYVDGAQSGSDSSYTETLLSGSRDFEIGAYGGASFYGNAIDNVLVYSDALSAAEVLRNYNAGKGSHRN